MGISLVEDGWGCWRDADHRGRAPARLLYKLLGERAQKYLPRMETLSEIDFAGAGLASRFATPTVTDINIYTADWSVGLQFTSPVAKGPPAFKHYLERRGISVATTSQYGLRAAMYGSLAWRILCPIQFRGAFQGWTGRTIGTARPRYLTGPGRVDSVNTLRLNPSTHKIVCVEGVFDALRLLECSKSVVSLGVVATHGTALSFAKCSQLRVLSSLAPLIFALDADAQNLSLRCALQFDADTYPPPPGRKDLGESTNQEIIQWITRL